MPNHALLLPDSMTKMLLKILWYLNELGAKTLETTLAMTKIVVHLSKIVSKYVPWKPTTIQFSSTFWTPNPESSGFHHVHGCFPWSNYPMVTSHILLVSKYVHDTVCQGVGPHLQKLLWTWKKGLRVAVTNLWLNNPWRDQRAFQGIMNSCSKSGLFSHTFSHSSNWHQAALCRQEDQKPTFQSAS